MRQRRENNSLGVDFILIINKYGNFYIVRGTPMLRNDYFHIFLKIIFCNSSPKTGYLIELMSKGFFSMRYHYTIFQS